MRKYTPAEAKERLQRLSEGARPKTKKATTKRGRPKRSKLSPVVRTCVTIAPELKIRAARDLGKGNFSRAVTLALTEALLKKDQETLNLT